MRPRPSSLALAAVLATSARAFQDPAASLTQAPAPPEPFQVADPVRVDSGRGSAACNETSVAISRALPLHAVAAWNDYRDGAPRVGLGLSLDGGSNWTDALLRPPLANQSAIEADPMTASDPRTGTLWAGGLSFGASGGVFVARKAPGSSTFEPAVMAYAGGGVDKGLMAAGPDPLDPDGHTLLYIAFNQGLIVSGDMGTSWSAPLALDAGIAFLPRVGPSGILYVAYWDTLDRIELIRSLDGGTTLEPPRLVAQRLDVWGLDGTRTPGVFRVPSFPALAVDPVTEALYCVYPDTTRILGANYDVDLYFTRSFDQGLTWSTPAVLAAGPSPGDQFFPWVEVDDAGRLHLLHYDTRYVTQADSAPQGWIDAAYAFSTDRGDSWTRGRLTASSFSSEHDGFGGIFIGDYLGMATAGGRTLPVYMSTEPGDADAFSQVITHGAATSYCFGLACPCGNVDPQRGCGNAGDDGDAKTGALLSSAGSNVGVRDDLRLRMSGLRPLTFGLLLASRNAISPPFGDGKRCLGGQVYRYPIRRADASGVLHYGPAEVVTLSYSFSPNGVVQPASTWNYQGWYRDAFGPCGSGFNLTNGLSVTWR